MSQDNTMSVADAAKFLSVSERTIRNYINKGLLSKRKEGRKAMVVSSEVISLKQDMDSTLPLVSREEMLRHRAKIRRLESHMEVVLRMLDAKDAPLNLSPSYSKELYTYAVDHLKKGSWSPEEIQPWTEIFDRLNEDDFEIMSKSAEDLHPWRVFLKLCTAMMGCVVSLSDYSTSLDLQNLHRVLAESRRRLRVSAFIYGEMLGALTPEIAGKYEAVTMSESLFRKILKKA